MHKRSRKQSKNTSFSSSSNESKKHKQNQNFNTNVTTLLSPNSISSILSSTKVNDMTGTEQDNGINAVESIVTMKDPKLTDVMKGIGSILLLLQEMKKDLQLSNQRIDNHDKEIELIKESCTKTDNVILDMKGELNILQQQHLENDIIISGFQSKLSFEECQNVVKNFSKLYDIDLQMIQNFYSFETLSNTDRKKIGFLCLSFANKQQKITFQEARKINGPPTYNQLIECANQDPIYNPTLRCYNKLTRMNIIINRELGNLKYTNKIYAYKFKNSCFHFKHYENSDFAPIKTTDELEKIIKTI